MKQQTILIANDDGVHALGIETLDQALSTVAKTHVVAPDRNRSGASNSLSLHAPLYFKTLSNGYTSVEGTPTDCVHLAINSILDEKPDMVVSGINEGSNLGDDILYSGTVFAAIEGRFLGLPSIAVSLVVTPNCTVHHYKTAAQVVLNLVKKMAQKPLPRAAILNVNVPNVPYQDLKGTQVTRMGRRYQSEPAIKDTDPRGKPIYWIGPSGKAKDSGPGTDFHAVEHDYVSVTPIRIDLTHYDLFQPLSQWVADL